MRGRIGATAAAGVIVGVGMILLGMEPRLVLVGLIVVTVSASASLLGDLANRTWAVSWGGNEHEYARSTEVDARVLRLSRTLRRTPSRRRAPVLAADEGDQPPNEIVTALIDVIDDLLVEDHGIDRSSSADAAAAVLGPELARFVTERPGSRVVSHRDLTRIVTLIEGLIAVDASTAQGSR